MALPNKSLDASGGSVFRINVVRRRLNGFAPPRQLRRYAADLMVAETLIPGAVPSSTFRWWGKRLILYNVGLVVAGILAFTAYVLVLIKFEDIIFSPNEDWDGFSGFVLVFQAFAYLFMMLVANVCFCLGPFLEKSLKPRNVARYRKITFRLGFWCSVALPFIIPVLLLFQVAYSKCWPR